MRNSFLLLLCVSSTLILCSALLNYPDVKDTHKVHHQARKHVRTPWLIIDRSDEDNDDELRPAHVGKIKKRQVPQNRPSDDDDDVGSGNDRLGPEMVINYLEDKFPDFIHTDEEKVKKTKLSGQGEVEEAPETIQSNISTTIDQTVETASITTTEEQTQPTITTVSTTLTKVPSSSSRPTTPTTTSSTSPVTETQECGGIDCSQWNLQIEPQFQSHLPGENVTVRCIVTGQINSTLLDYAWYFADEKGMFLGNDDTLFLKEAKLEDSGTRLCVASDIDGCCVKSATGEVVVYEKPAYLTHIFVLVGVIVGLLLIVCAPMIVHLRRRYRNMRKKEDSENDDTQTLTL